MHCGKTMAKVIIVGAGASGIACATRLIAKGFDVTILEAENRIGGRIHSVHFGGTNVDLGAQWIHGEKGNVVYEMVENLNLTDYPKSSTYSNMSFFTSTGTMLDKKLTNQLYEIVENILEESDLTSEHEGSLREYFDSKYTEQVNAKLGNENKELLNAVEFIRNWFSKFYLCMDPAEDLAQVSVNSLVKYRECKGNHLVHWKTNGFASFLNVLLENNPKSFLTEHVLLNKEVIKIVWDQTGDSKDRGKVKLFCADSSRFTADHVILTVSIGVLKETYQTLFKPSLPLCKINFLETIPIGTCQKIIIKFPNKWWPDEVKDFSFVWTDEDKKTLPKEFPFGPIRNERSWLEDIFGFYTVDSDPNILLGWLVGSLVKEVELLSDELLMNASLFLLRKFAGEIYKISEPSEIIRSKWGTNPHFLGTYSYVGVEMEAREATREDLAKPLVVDGKEVVLFAGEATHSCYFSTVHGAVESGWREADRLIERSYKSRRHKVVIVGAGIAGLAAATKLLENKIDDFLLLEAQEEAGGRIKTVQIGNKPIDLGAQWMHGKSNPLYDLAKEKQLISDEMSEEGLGLYVRSNGKILDKFMVDKVAFKVGQILEDCSKLVSENSGCTALGTILEQHFFRYLEEHVPDESEAEVMKELYDWHVRFQVIDNSCKDLSKLSAKRWADYVCLDDEAHANMKHGYQSLVQLLLDGLPDNQVKFNTEVTKISFSPQSEIKLDLLAGGSIVCEHLILTPSLGVLKEFQGLSNVLPESLMVNIANMGFASICKVYLFYDRKWWGDSQGFQLLWSSDHNATWQRHITGFDEVFNHENTLMTWVGGDSVREVERLPAEEVGKQCTELLRTFLPNYSVPEPMEVIRTQWLSNPFIKGSYSHITPECDDCNAGINALKQPVLVDGVPRILLAGEAIHSSHYSTTHGAYESGLDQAQVLCDFLLENKPAI
uniref:Amine oxidase domain-containing protein n=1 Tax=Dendroctonus ponderosae TaxID=77166 RepID=A0AAR5PBI1_DENPD